MTTTLERTSTEQASGVAGGGYCDGCPRCRDPKASWCQQPHPEYNGLHPVCKVCGHCVLRGTHKDDASDLKG